MGSPKAYFFLMLTSKDTCPSWGPYSGADGGDSVNFQVLQV